MTPSDDTAAVTPEDDGLSIPDFLLRNPDNSLKFPSVVQATPTVVETGNLVDELPAPPLPPAAGEFDQIEKKKSYARIRKMKAKKESRDALAAGKVWDPVHGGWK